MKLRSGFISNSSTTSFCIYGIKIEGYNNPDFDLNDTNLTLIFGNSGLESYYLGYDISILEELNNYELFKNNAKLEITKILNDESIELDWYIDADIDY